MESILHLHDDQSHSFRGGTLINKILNNNGNSYTRGTPKCIYSDNGINFRGANGEMKIGIQNIDKDEMQQRLAVHQVEWSFIPAAAPHNYMRSQQPQMSNRIG